MGCGGLAVEVWWDVASQSYFASTISTELLQLVERRQNQELAHGVQKAPGGFDWAFFQMNIPKDEYSHGLLASFSPFPSGSLCALLPFLSF